MRAGWIAAAWLALAGCLPIDPVVGHQPIDQWLDFEDDAHRPRYVAPGPRPEPDPIQSLTLATFNLRVFGRSKASDPLMVDTLAEIITTYDVVAVQEIKDISETAPYVLAAAVAARSPDHVMVLGPRSGLQPDDRTSQEQYAYFYDARRVSSESPGEIYDDSAEDRFQREPFVARFRAVDGGPSFVLVNIHTRPAAAVEEIDALDPVFVWTRARHLDADAIIALGDFNAGCRYASPEALDALPIRGPAYVWAIPDDADTNVAASECAYDRVVFDERGASTWSGQWGVDQPFESSAVSDHWPVWVELTWTSTDFEG